MNGRYVIAKKMKTVLLSVYVEKKILDIYIL